MMKEIPLSRGLVALVDDLYFDWLSQWKWYANPAKGRALYYAIREIWVTGAPNKKVYMHRAITNAVTGEQVDHADGYGLNNQRYNLRCCTQGQNNGNSRWGLGISGFRGVRPQRNRWVARIGQYNEHLGSFGTPEEAARAYDRAAIERFGDFATLNFSQNAPPVEESA